MWHWNDIDPWPQGQGQGHHKLAPSIPYNFCKESFSPKCFTFRDIPIRWLKWDTVYIYTFSMKPGWRGEGEGSNDYCLFFLWKYIQQKCDSPKIIPLYLYYWYRFTVLNFEQRSKNMFKFQVFKAHENRSIQLILVSESGRCQTSLMDTYWQFKIAMRSLDMYC